MPAETTDASPAELERELRAAVAGEVRFDVVSRGLYATDASIYQVWPVGVVFPRSRADVSAVLRIAAQRRVPVLPRGGGTSLSGQSIGPAIVLDFSRFMNRILEFEPDRGLVRVEAGVVLQQLNSFLRPYGREFGPDVSTASRAALGGMIGNNSAGAHSLIHGKTIDHVRELTVVLADGSEIVCGPLAPDELARKQAQPDLEGRIYRQFPTLIENHRSDILARFPRILRRVSGYNFDAFLPEMREKFPQAPSSRELDRQFPDRMEFNLSRLIVGSEGTLGIVTEALLHTVPLPKERGVAALKFESTEAAVKAVPRLLECRPAAIELIDRLIVEMAQQNLHFRRALDFVHDEPGTLLIVEFYGESRHVVDDALQWMQQTIAGFPGLQHLLVADLPELREQIWRCREAGAPLLLSIPGARKPIAFVEDTAVDPQRLPDFTRRFRAILANHGTEGAYYGHASVGCLHIRPLIDTKSAADLVRLESIADDVAELVREFKGAMTGEHGDGLARSRYNKILYGPKLFQAFEQVKALFDPLGLLNPGKVAATPSPVENLRYGAAYRGVALPAFLDFSREAEAAGMPAGQGFLAAAEQCNGSGVCRKTHTGTMCPSYMATRDEEHSTRGRANALRLALSGQLPADALTSPRMRDVFELCLMCKACKAECPSNVDVAKLKVEFLAHYHQIHAPRLGERLLAHVAWLNRIGSALAPFSNVVSRLPGLRTMISWLLGIDARRPLPRFARRNFGRWFRGHVPHPEAGTRGTVVLLDDCLTSYCEPQVNRAAVELLERAGFRVVRAEIWCCGRPLISKGFLDQAKRLARQNLQRLQPFLEQGWPLLGAEPSCLLTFVDEYPDLVPSNAAQTAARNAFLVEDWLLQQGVVGPLSSTGAKIPRTILLHGHCQQRALVGLQGTRALLKQLPGAPLVEPDAGCCGMAGAFGYEHFDVSQQIGERVLFPAVRQHDGPVAAPGFSCRHQIREATGVQPVHPLELLAAAWGAAGTRSE